MIEFRNLTKIYYPNKKSMQEVEALKGISGKIHSRGMVLIVGKSGSGKSTLLNVLSGLDNVNSGEIIIDGLNISNFNTEQMESFRRKDIGFMFQDSNLINSLTVYENLLLSLSFLDIIDTEQVISNILEKVGLQGFESRYPYELSGGEKQRVALARALVKSPKIIFADEPTGNLDQGTSDDILQLLRNIANERLVVLITHEKEYINIYGDQVIELKDGEIIRDFMLNEVLSEKNEAKCISDYCNTKKLSNKIILSLSLSNFKTRFYRSLIVLFMFVLSLIALTVTLSLYQYETIDGIDLTIKMNNSKYIYLYDSDQDRYGNTIHTYDYIDRALIRDSILKNEYMQIPNSGSELLMLGGSNIFRVTNKILVESIDEISRFGLDFYKNQYLELNEDSVVLSDFSIDHMIYENDMYFNFDTQIQYIYFVRNGNSEIPLEQLHYAYEDFVGKEIVVYYPVDENTKLYIDSFLISGVYQTLFTDYFDENNEYYVNLTEDDKQNWIMLWNHVYKTYINVDYDEKHDYYPGYFYAEGSNLFSLSSGSFLDRGYSLLININEDSFDSMIDIQSYEDVLENDRTFILTNTGILDDTYNLQTNEVVINLDLYNAINNSSYQPTDFISDGNILELPNLEDEYVEFNIEDLQLGNSAYKRVFKIAGLYIREYDEYYPEAENFKLYFNNVNQESITDVYNNVYTVLCVYLNNNYSDLSEFLKFYEKQNILPMFQYSNVFYSIEGRISQINTLTLLISASLLIISVLMIANLVAVSINSKRKEIGILMASGYGKRELVKIFLFESLLLGLTAFIILLLLQPIIVHVLNIVVVKSESEFIQLFSIKLFSILTLFLTTIIIPIISTVLPLKRFTSLKPVDCIRKAI